MIVEEEKKREKPINPLDTQGNQLNLDESQDDSVLNRIIQVRSIPQSKSPKGETGILYYDSTNKKLKIYINDIDKWADIPFTTTSTSTSTSTTTT